MAFSKAFPKTSDKSVYPKWNEIYLTEEEEREQEELARKENMLKMQECIEDAKKIIETKNLKKYQSDMINLAVALFDKRAGHEIHYKESKAKDKFDLKQK
jgi:hypothetical protein